MEGERKMAKIKNVVKVMNFQALLRMDKALKEVRPVKYSSAAVKILHFTMKPHTICFKLHWHDRVEFIKVKKGQLLIQCCGNTLKLKAGEMALFPPKTVHGGSSETEAVAYDVLMFDLKMFLNLF